MVNKPFSKNKDIAVEYAGLTCRPSDPNDLEHKIYVPRQCKAGCCFPIVKGVDGVLDPNIIADHELLVIPLRKGDVFVIMGNMYADCKGAYCEEDDEGNLHYDLVHYVICVLRDNVPVFGWLPNSVLTHGAYQFNILG